MNLRPVVGFERWYLVNETGKVFSKHRDIWLKPYKVGAGYHRVGLYYHGKTNNKYVHHIVAEAFIGPAYGREINHKNGDKTDNHVDNLEWVTRSQNNQHKHYELGHAIKPVTGTCLTTGDVRMYASVERTKVDGFEPKHVSAVCLGKRKTHMGWKFEFTPPQRQPLTDEQIKTSWPNTKFDFSEGVEDVLMFARAIEAAHGIKGEA